LLLFVSTIGLTIQAQGKIDPTNGIVRTVLDMLRVILGVEDNCFIEKKIELNFYRIDDKLITYGVIKEEQDFSIVVGKKTILKSAIRGLKSNPSNLIDGKHY